MSSQIYLKTKKVLKTKYLSYLFFLRQYYGNVFCYNLCVIIFAVLPYNKDNLQTTMAAKAADKIEKQVKDPVSVHVFLVSKWKSTGSACWSRPETRSYSKISWSTSPRTWNSTQRSRTITPSCWWSTRTRAELSRESILRRSSMMKCRKPTSQPKSMIDLKLWPRFLRISGSSHKPATRSLGGMRRYLFDNWAPGQKQQVCAQKKGLQWDKLRW